MNKLLLFCVLACGINSAAIGQTTPPTPRAPLQMPKATAVNFINNYKNNVTNFFAYGYLIDINKAKTVSPTASRVYNGLSGTNQSLIMVPLNSTFKVNTAGSNFMQDGNASLCPHACDVASPGESAAIPGAQVNTMVNTCINCNQYEAANAVVIHTNTLNSLLNAGFNFVRVYNGMDATGKRYVVYVPVDANGAEVLTDNVWVGDNTCVLNNCKYP